MKHLTYILKSFKKTKTSTLAMQLISSKVAKSFIMVFFIVTSYAFSQVIEIETYNVECGADNVFRRNERRMIETLSFGCAKTILLQDNSITYIKNVEGLGTLKRGDAGGGVRIDSLGIDRRPGDAPPLVVFWKCLEDYDIEILANIEVTYQNQDCYGSNN